MANKTPVEPVTYTYVPFSTKLHYEEIEKIINWLHIKDKWKLLESERRLYVLETTFSGRKFSWKTQGEHLESFVHNMLIDRDADL